MKQDAISMYPLDDSNKTQMWGCCLKEVIHDDRLNADVFIFNNSYTKTNIDLIFWKGRFFVSSRYGETMDRKTIFYVPDYEGSITND